MYRLTFDTLHRVHNRRDIPKKPNDEFHRTKSPPPESNLQHARHARHTWYYPTNPVILSYNAAPPIPSTSSRRPWNLSNYIYPLTVSQTTSSLIASALTLPSTILPGYQHNAQRQQNAEILCLRCSSALQRRHHEQRRCPPLGYNGRGYREP